MFRVMIRFFKFLATTVRSKDSRLGRQFTHQDGIIAGSTRHDICLQGMKCHGMDATLVSRQQVEFVGGIFIPNVHQAIGTAGRDHHGIRIASR